MSNEGYPHQLAALKFKQTRTRLDTLQERVGVLEQAIIDLNAKIQEWEEDDGRS